jgi:hypothetical protein
MAAIFTFLPPPKDRLANSRTGAGYLTFSAREARQMVIYAMDYAQSRTIEGEKRFCRHRGGKLATMPNREQIKP